mmetsp:Transcript_5583/g.13962  ORF Transcript_5583/g.13962 Transcript_5583/m.13962 type:complete len:138 (-) Transcript_5583:272-685(-)|eukprot:CAMPEP_0181088974 /NCGR_PEP_ID=MMETSP1071-20121207/7062_1 /TAXON_ID=35127 /ORGANISM="Thalassiosira sp., Strain NH16" /LENGTH=137 /DNA_ID=CAMNT_0023170905 /DNA_START=146 /DNA_END=559 /DNA_ORIENTATION=+
MVKVGDFTVELVRADTKEVFKEHVGIVPENNIYAEVEPDVEYFVSLGSSIGGVRSDITVDGISLGYYNAFLGPFTNAYKGSFERKDSRETTKALRFKKTPDKAEGVMPSMLTGNVKVEFHSLGAKSYVPTTDWKPPE